MCASLPKWNLELSKVQMPNGIRGLIKVKYMNSNETIKIDIGMKNRIGELSSNSG